MQSVTRGSFRMLRQKPASSFVTNQKHSPSYSYQAGFTFGQPSSPIVPTFAKIFVSAPVCKSRTYTSCRLTDGSPARRWNRTYRPSGDRRG